LIASVTPTDAYDKDGNVIVHRPENVVGAYVVHMSNPAINYEGGKLYRTGQMGIIYRPKITDAQGSWTWEVLNIDKDKGLLTITIPQDFLDKAVYPISSKGTQFGWTTIGASTNSESSDYMIGARYQLTQAASNITQMAVYTSNNTTHMKAAFYADSSNVPNTLVSGNTTGVSTLTNDWTTVTFNTGKESAAYYWLIFDFDVSSLIIHYTSNASYQEDYRQVNYVSVWPASYGTPDGNNPNFEVSEYATYSVSTYSPIILKKNVILEKSIIFR
jgi:hypothetical protein